MSVIPFVPERRRRRSANTYQAIKFQLEYIFGNQNLRNITVGDSRGLLLAYAGDAQDAQALAAYAPLIANCTNKTRYEDLLERVRTFVPEAAQDTFAFRSFVVDGEELHITLVGESGKLSHADLYRAVSGIRRIIDESKIAA